jgi:Fuc2NAc and GlcNAc transferase
MIYFLVFASSFVFTYLIREYALKKNILDIPNDRSSHYMPTPRGGGLAIVVSFFIGITYLFFDGLIEQKLFLALLCSLPLVIVSLLDDIYTLTSKVKFLIQVISVVPALFFLESLNIFNTIFVLWLINLYNFLDGIDGYASMEAIFVSVASYLIFNHEALILIAIASLGFLPFNWQRASIFMGDVGSTFLGFVFGIFTVYYTHSIGDFIVWILLFSVFILDATFTLMKRLLNKENIFQAHKKHIYQRAVQSGLSHQRVVLYALVVNIAIFILIGIFR